MKLELFRWMLMQRRQMDAFERRSVGDIGFTREQWMRDILSVTTPFLHRKNDFYFVPAQSPDPRFIVGRIGRKMLVKEHEPPTSGLVETTRDQWQAVDVFIDPRSHEDGQKIAIEVVKRVGNPTSLLQSLADHLNHRVDPPEPFLIESNSIMDLSSFRDFVKQHQGEIVSVTFELVTPNMFGIRDEIDKELRELREIEHARKAKITLQNEDGLVLETGRVDVTAEHASDGGGSITAKTKNGLIFNSKSNAKTVIVDDPVREDGKDRDESVFQILRRLFSR